MEQKKQIIYSAKIMTQLIELGFYPEQTIANPRFPQYNCWVFDMTAEFQKVLSQLLGGIKDG